MNKETLIRTILAALTAGTASAITAVAVTSEMLRDPETAKYAKTIRYQQRLLKKRDALNRYTQRYIERQRVASGGKVLMGSYTVYRVDPKAKAMKLSINMLVDEMIIFMMKNFDDGSEISQEAGYLCSDMFEGWIKFDTMSIEGLQAIIDVVIPTAVLRHVIQQKVQIDTLIAKEFVTFAMRYKDMIMGRSRPYEDRLVLYPDNPRAQNAPYWARRA